MTATFPPTLEQPPEPAGSHPRAAHDAPEDRELPLLDHLIELRKRLINCLYALFACWLICYAVSDKIYALLMRPLAAALGPDSGRHMIYTGLTEAFTTYLQVAFWAGCMLASPLVLVQVWKFIAPGLYKNERSAVLPFLAATPVLFCIGAGFAYGFVFPIAWRFFLSFQTPGGPGVLPIELEARVGEYLSLVMRLIFAFGLAFEMPVFLLLLVRAGILSAATLAAKRRYAILAVFIFAAVITPPDVFSQISLALPLLGLYEISVWLARGIERRRDAAITEDAKDIPHA